ncbi:MAG: hypothetical protein ACP5JH_07120 [Bacteroidota bacterium]
MRHLKILSALLMLGVGIALVFALNGCYTELETVRTESEGSYYSPTYGYESSYDSTQAAIINNYYFYDGYWGYPRYRFLFRFYYPSWYYWYPTWYSGYYVWYDPWVYDYWYWGYYDPWLWWTPYVYYGYPGWYGSRWYGWWDGYPAIGGAYATTRWRTTRDFGSTRGGVTRGTWRGATEGGILPPAGTSTGRGGEGRTSGTTERGGAIRSGTERTGFAPPTWGGTSRQGSGDRTIERSNQPTRIRTEGATRGGTRTTPPSPQREPRSGERTGTVRPPRSEPTPHEPSVTPPPRESNPGKESPLPRNEGSTRQPRRMSSPTGGYRTYSPPSYHYSPPNVERPAFSEPRSYSPPPRSESSGGSYRGSSGSSGGSSSSRGGSEGRRR